MLTNVKCRWLNPEQGELDVPVESCRACAGSGHNPCGYPLPLIKLMTKNRDPNVVGCSATMFEGCPREQGLKVNFDYSVRPEEAYTRAYGSLVHLGAEVLSAEDGGRVEERYGRELTLRDGRVMKVTAAMDVMHHDPSGGTVAIRDYKVIPSVTDSEIARRIGRYVSQFSIQRWILDGHGIRVTDVELVFLAQKGKRNVPLYPDGDPTFADARLWSLDETEGYLLARGPVLMDSLAGRYPPPLMSRAGNWMCRRCDVREICCHLYGGLVPGLQ